MPKEQMMLYEIALQFVSSVYFNQQDYPSGVHEKRTRCQNQKNVDKLTFYIAPTMACLFSSLHPNETWTDWNQKKKEKDGLITKKEFIVNAPLP